MLIISLLDDKFVEKWIEVLVESCNKRFWDLIIFSVCVVGLIHTMLLTYYILM